MEQAERVERATCPSILWFPPQVLILIPARLPLSPVVDYPPLLPVARQKGHRATSPESNLTEAWQGVRRITTRCPISGSAPLSALEGPPVVTRCDHGDTPAGTRAEPVSTQIGRVL